MYYDWTGRVDKNGKGKRIHQVVKNTDSLLDKYLELNGQEFLSPFLTELTVQWAVKGPSYRDARDRFKDILGYQVMSHETIRQKVKESFGVIQGRMPALTYDDQAKPYIKTLRSLAG